MKWYDCKFKRRMNGKQDISKDGRECRKCILRLDYIIKQLSVLRKESYMAKTILNFKEAKDYTGLSSSQLYKLTRLNVIPCYRPTGRLIYFNREELDTWLMSNSVLNNENTK